MNLELLGWNEFFQISFQMFDASYTPARVMRHNRNIYTVVSANGELTAQISGKLMHETIFKQDFPVVGDWVALSERLNEQSATIHAVIPRKSYISRKEAGSRSDEQLIAANIDTVFIVTSADSDFSLRRTERYLAAAWDGGASPVIIINKSDLSDNIRELAEQMSEISFGTPVHAVSALNAEGTQVLKNYLAPGKTVVFAGSSGVGKSSLINLLASEQQKIGAVRESDGKGRHTTTSREMLFTDSGGIIIDTPGMREFQQVISEEILEETYRDVENLAENCRFKDCTHIAELGCAVIAAVDTGELSEGRLKGYRKMLREQRFTERRINQREHQAELARWKKISKSVKGIMARKEKIHI